MVSCSHCVCTLEYWLWDNLESFFSGNMHSPVSIGLQCTILAYAFYVDSNVWVHCPAKCPLIIMLGYFHGTPDLTLGHFHGTPNLVKLAKCLMQWSPWGPVLACVIDVHVQGVWQLSQQFLFNFWIGLQSHSVWSEISWNQSWVIHQQGLCRWWIVLMYSARYGK